MPLENSSAFPSLHFPTTLELLPNSPTRKCLRSGWPVRSHCLASRPRHRYPHHPRVTATARTVIIVRMTNHPRHHHHYPPKLIYHHPPPPTIIHNVKSTMSNNITRITHRQATSSSMAHRPTVTPSRPTRAPLSPISLCQRRNSTTTITTITINNNNSSSIVRAEVVVVAHPPPVIASVSH